jgi:plasmid stabilization system protein ParE
MIVRYTHRALNDLEAIYAELDEHAPDVAQGVKDLLERRILGDTEVWVVHIRDTRRRPWNGER